MVVFQSRVNKKMDVQVHFLAVLPQKSFGGIFFVVAKKKRAVGDFRELWARRDGVESVNWAKATSER